MIEDDHNDVLVVVAAHNAQKTIEQCLDALLELSYQNYNIVVVDNNSSDNTSEIIKKYSQNNNKISYRFESKQGWPAARNSVIRGAKEQYIANIDDDCFATTEWLSNLMAGFTSKDIGCVVGKTLVEPGITMAEKYYSSTDPFNIEHHIGINPFVPWGGGNNVFLRKAFLKAGGYNDKEFVSGADGEFHARMERDAGYRTVFKKNALIYHEARGSLKEFFKVHMKYAFDGHTRSILYPEVKERYRWYIIRKIRDIFINFAGFFVRLLRFILGKETKLRLVSPIYMIVKMTGSICGNLKGKLGFKPGK